MTMRHLVIAASAVVAAALALSGCGSGEPVASPGATASAGQSPTRAPPAAQSPDPCTLVTAAEVSAALGGTSGAGTVQSGGLPNQRTCAFDAGPAGLATVGVVPGGMALYDQLTALMDTTVTPVSGIGDAAARDAGQLTVVKGQWVLFIFVSGKDSDGQYAAATSTLAKAAVARL